nr:hypothetical protein [Kiritimatiellia bacterium]
MRESRLAIRGMMTLGTGHALNVLLGLVMVTWVPRYFGVTDYGHWVWFRSLIGFLVGFGLLGAGDVMARFYMGYRSEGCPEDAGRVFKSVLVFRCVLAVALAAVGCGLVLASDSAFAHPRAGLLLSVSVVFQTLTVTFNLLLYGERRLGWQVA